MGILSEYSCVRCLFCNTGKEKEIVRLIHEHGWGRAIFPQRIKTVMKNGVWTEQLVPLLPGYVFVYAAETDPERKPFRDLTHVLRVLTYDDGTDILYGHDLDFAQWLWSLDGCVGMMKAVKVGDRVEIIDGVFRQLHGTIIRMDRRRKTVCVALDTQGTPKQLWLAYEIVEKSGEETAT
ncbi:MAG: transcription termination/antitermination NusG family protein [Aristaeellaceae bacterium]